MDINEIASRAAATPLPPRQINSAPGLQTMPGPTHVRGPSLAAQVQPTQTSESSSENQGTLEELRAAVEKIQEFVSSTASDIKFSIDEESGRTVVRVVDSETQEVIRQIPSQEMLDLAQALDKLQGLLIKQKA